MVILNILYLQNFSNNPLFHEIAIKVLPYTFIALIISLIHLFVLYKFPSFHQNSRIILMSILDVSVTIWVMYLADELAVYYAALLLWFIIGYGMRFGTYVGYITYINVLIGWSLILVFNRFWNENIETGIGWLIAYTVIPLYFFKLVKELKINIHQLHKEVDISHYQALHDPLTQLPNRIYFNESLEKFVKEYEQKKKKFALLFIDLDGFKDINDSYGHEAGDSILIEASQRIASINGFTSRLGGDEFVSIKQYSSKEELEEILHTLMDNLRKECPNHHDIQLSASVGVALYPDDAKTLYDLKKKSDIAMYKAKEFGRNRYMFYSDI